VTTGSAQSDRPLPKRFYKEVGVEAETPDGGAPGGAWCLLLDGRPVKTPGKVSLAVPSAALAEEIAQEWRAQDEFIDPESMPITKIVNSAIDGVSGREKEVAADIVAFAGSDLVCYRAEEPAELVVRQAEAWDPVLRWAQDVLGAHFVLAEGVMPVAQPEDALRAFASAIDGYESLELCALHVMTTLTGSAILSLAHARGAMSAELVWAAAHVDEDFQIAQWGEDDEAAARREKRLREFQAASLVCRALSQDPQHASINPPSEN
jgi:chaperone required for assembly of F1-ATPase